MGALGGRADAPARAASRDDERVNFARRQIGLERRAPERRRSLLLDQDLVRPALKTRIEIGQPTIALESALIEAVQKLAPNRAGGFCPFGSKAIVVKKTGTPAPRDAASISRMGPITPATLREPRGEDLSSQDRAISMTTTAESPQTQLFHRIRG